MSDPLVATLMSLQANANNKNAQGSYTWDAINSINKNQGAPMIRYDQFAARWETDPMLKQIVDRFDGHGLVIKTNAAEPEKHGGHKKSKISQMAKRATSKALK